MSESMIVGGVDLGDEAALPTEPGFYSETHIYPALGWYLDKRGDWHFIFATGHSENRGKTGPLDSGLIVNGKPVGELFRLIPTSEVTGKHTPNRHSLPPRTGAQSQGRKLLHQCDSEGTQDATGGLDVEAIYDSAFKALLEAGLTLSYSRDGVQIPRMRIAIDAAIPEIRSQLTALIRARIDEDAAGKIHNNPSTFNKGIGINIGLERAAQTVEGTN